MNVDYEVSRDCPAWAQPAELHGILTAQLQAARANFARREEELLADCDRWRSLARSLEADMAVVRQDAAEAEAAFDAEGRRAEEAEAEVEELRLEIGRARREAAERLAAASAEAARAEAASTAEVLVLRRRLCEEAQGARSARLQLSDERARADVADAASLHTRSRMLERTRGDAFDTAMLQLEERAATAEADAREWRECAAMRERAAHLLPMGNACRWCRNKLQGAIPVARPLSAAAPSASAMPGSVPPEPPPGTQRPLQPSPSAGQWQRARNDEAWEGSSI